MAVLAYPLSIFNISQAVVYFLQYQITEVYGEILLETQWANHVRPLIYLCSFTISKWRQTTTTPEDVAKECVKNWRTDGLYNNYKIEPQYEEYLFKTAKQSIQSACDKEYCIIYKEIKP